MTTSELLSDLIVRGVEFQAHGDKLRFRPVEKLNRDDVENIRRHKTALLRLLRAEGHEYRDPDADPRPLLACDRCEATEFTDVTTHNGQSIRRDCAHCHRFLGWPRWYGQTLNPKESDT